MKAKSIVRVPIKTDGSVFAIEFLDDQEKAVTVEFPGSELLALARLLQAASQHAPVDTRPPTGTAKSFPITKFEIGLGFPDGLSLALYTQAFGRMGFAMDSDTAQQVAQALQACTAHLQGVPPTQGH